MDLDRELRKLKRELERAPKDSRGHRSFSEVLQQRVIAYVAVRTEATGSMAAVARELGLAQRTVWTWMRETSSALREIEVIEHDARRSTVTSRSIRIVLLNGAVIENLDVEQAIAIA